MQPNHCLEPEDGTECLLQYPARTCLKIQQLFYHQSEYYNNSQLVRFFAITSSPARREYGILMGAERVFCFPCGDPCARYVAFNETATRLGNTALWMSR